MIKKLLIGTLSVLLSVIAVDQATLESTMYIEGYGSTASLDRYGHEINPKAFENSLERINKYGLPSYFDHIYYEDFVAGSIEEARIDDHGLYIKIKISKTLQPNLKRLLDEELYRYFSIGGIPVFEVAEDGESVIIKEFDLIEVSIVAQPANPHCFITKTTVEETSLIRNLIK